MSWTMNRAPSLGSRIAPPFGKQRKSKRMQHSFPAGNGDLPAFLSLTGHLLQKPRGEAMNAESDPLVCRASLTPGEDGVASPRG